jgi:hypothetical protein
MDFSFYPLSILVKNYFCKAQILNPTSNASNDNKKKGCPLNFSPFTALYVLIKIAIKKFMDEMMKGIIK